MQLLKFTLALAFLCLSLTPATFAQTSLEEFKSTIGTYLENDPSFENKKEVGQLLNLLDAQGYQVLYNQRDKQIDDLIYNLKKYGQTPPLNLSAQITEGVKGCAAILTGILLAHWQDECSNTRTPEPTVDFQFTPGEVDSNSYSIYKSYVLSGTVKACMMYGMIKFKSLALSLLNRYRMPNDIKKSIIDILFPPALHHTESDLLETGLILEAPAP